MIEMGAIKNNTVNKQSFSKKITLKENKIITHMNMLNYIA
jgi:hypothetical protein